MRLNQIVLKCLFYAILLIAFGCSSEESRKDQDPKELTQREQILNQLENRLEHKYSVKLIGDVNKGWGYDLYDHGKLMIHQLYIPAVSGNQYFHSEAEAQKVGELAINKIKLGEFPPSVSIDELRELKITFEE